MAPWTLEVFLFGTLMFAIGEDRTLELLTQV
jgi:hypothetical protein